jgi:hypothetical protein
LNNRGLAVGRIDLLVNAAAQKVVPRGPKGTIFEIE